MIERVSGRVALIIVAVAILVIFLLGWFVLLSPERAKATKLDGQIEEADTQLTAVNDLLHGPVAKQSAAALRISKIAVPDGTNMPQILRQLSVASAQAGVELDDITPSAPVAAAAGLQIPIAVSVNGHYFALRHFFRILRSRAVLNGDKLHANGRLYTVDNISFSGTAAAAPGTQPQQSQASAPNLVAASVTINAFAFTPLLAAPGTTPTTSSANTTVTPPVATSP